MISIISDPKLANSQIFVEICEGQFRHSIFMVNGPIRAHGPRTKSEKQFQENNGFKNLLKKITNF